MIFGQWFQKKDIRIGNHSTKLPIIPLKLGVAP